MFSDDEPRKRPYSDRETSRPYEDLSHKNYQNKHRDKSVPKEQDFSADRDMQNSRGNEEKKKADLSDFAGLNLDNLPDIPIKKTSPSPSKPTKRNEEVRRFERTSKSRESQKSHRSHRSQSRQSDRSYSKEYKGKYSKSSISRQKSPYKERQSSHFKPSGEKRSHSPIDSKQSYSGSKRPHESSGYKDYKDPYRSRGNKFS